jgi:hypothetical protein
VRKLFMFLGLGAIVLVQPSQAQILKYKAFMDGPSESPPVASPGIGTALVTFDLGALPPTLHVQAEFSGLVSPTTVAHIHCCIVSPATTVGVATYPGTFPGFPVGVTSGTYDNAGGLIDLSLTSSYTGTFLTAGGGTAAGARAFLIDGLNNGRGYFNIHSQLHPGGEIRGFLFFVPEPSSLMLVTFGAVGMLMRRRQR